MTMIERVAAAIDECPEWPAKTYRQRVARAALEAMLEPRVSMTVAMMDPVDSGRSKHTIFRAAIQAALDEEQR